MPTTQLQPYALPGRRYSFAAKTAATDTTAPTLINATATATGTTTADLSVETDEGNGTLYTVVTTSATAPTAAQVKAGQDHAGSAAVFNDSQAISTTGSKSFSASGLTASTTYYAHFMHEDAATNQSSVASATAFTTDAAPATNSRNKMSNLPALGLLASRATYTRDEATVDWQGNLVPAGDVMPGRPAALPAGEVEPTVTTHDSYAGGITFLGSGFDADGVTPMAMFLDGAAETIRIYRDELDTPIRSVPFSDFDDGSLSYVPKAGKVIRGMLVLLMQRADSGTSEGVTLFYSVDGGASWTKITDTNGDDLTSPGTGAAASFGREWALSAFAGEETSGSLEIWIGWVDYQSNPDAEGGFAAVSRAALDKSAGVWSAGDAYKILEITGGNHLHTVAFSLQGDRLRGVVARGDTLSGNALIEVECDLSDGHDTYTASANWTTSNDSFHGKATGTDSTSLHANQFAGAVTGPGDSILVAGDVDATSVFKIEWPDAYGGKAIITPIFGAQNGQANTWTNIWIDRQEPHRGPYVSRQYPDTSTGDPDARVLMSHNGNHWFDVFAKMRLGNLWGNDEIVFGVNSVGLQTFPVPGGATAVSPIAIRPGGHDWRRYPTTGYSSSFPAGSGDGISGFCVDAAGDVWISPSQGDCYDRTGSFVLPSQPPGFGPVFDFTANQDDFFFGGWRLRQNVVSTASNFTQKCVSLFAMAYEDGAIGGYDLLFNVFKRWKASYNRGRWLSYHNRETDLPTGNGDSNQRYSTFGVNPGRYFIQLRSLRAVNDGTFREIGPCYPHERLHSGEAVDEPDIQLSVGPLEKDDIEVEAALRIPHDGWDSPTLNGFGINMPLFSLRQDADNYISVELVPVDSDNTTLRANVVKGGTDQGDINITGMNFIRDGVFFVKLNVKASSVEMTGSYANRYEQGTQSQATAMNSGSWEMRFGAPDWSDVGTFDVLAVKTNVLTSLLPIGGSPVDGTLLRQFGINPQINP